MERRIPRDPDGCPHALVSRTPFGVDVQGAFSRSARVWRNGQVLVDRDRLDADGPANPNNPSIDGGCVQVTVKRNLAP
jgi:hypothetical protein